MQIWSDARSIELKMDEVTLVDADMIRFLIGCEARGIELRGYPRYAREWIRRETHSE
ncbi:MAG: hypothetical protein JO189_08685 [Deltaproteobacteria bacterium]|nr:hypothetical protein [Deltaproteobacteria bacterium]